MGKNIGLISTRFAGTDGVTLESSKWAEVLENNGHSCFWFAGELDRGSERGYLVPEAHFQYEKNEWINKQVFGKKARQVAVTDLIHELRSLLKVQLRDFIRKFNIDLLIEKRTLSQ